VNYSCLLLFTPNPLYLFSIDGKSANALKESAKSSAGQLALQCAGFWTGLIQVLNEAER
jgi:hypothetical protein